MNSMKNCYQKFYEFENRDDEKSTLHNSES